MTRIRFASAPHEEEGSAFEARPESRRLRPVSANHERRVAVGPPPLASRLARSGAAALDVQRGFRFRKVVGYCTNTVACIATPWIVQYTLYVPAAAYACW